MSTMRERVVRWDDPAETTQALRAMGGLEALRAIITKQLPAPPVADLIGYQIVTAERGEVSASMAPTEAHYNPMGIVHGGIIATLLDTVMGCAVHSVMPLGRGYTTLNINVQYLRPLRIELGEVTAFGTVVHAGRSTATAEGRLLDRNGKLCATAQTTCLLFDVAPTAP